MTVSSTTSRVSYSGNGSTTAFAVSFYFLENTHLKVILRAADGTETVKALTTDYTVSGAGNPAGGTVTMNTAPATGTTLVIVRNVPLTQETDYQANDPFPAESHERALDKLTMAVQQQQLQLDRSIKVPATTPTNVSTELPNPEMNKLIGWNESATGLQNIDGGTLATIVAYGTARSDVFTGDGVQTAFTLSYNPGSLNNLDVSIDGATQVNGVDFTWAGGTTLTMTTAVPNGSKLLVRYMQGLPTTTADSDDVQYLPASGSATTVQARLRMYDAKVPVSVKDFGAKGDGVTDDTAAIQAALNSAIHVVFPEGTYLCKTEPVMQTANGYAEGLGEVVLVQDTYGYSGIQVRATGCTIKNIKFKNLKTKTQLSESLANRYEGEVSRSRACAVYLGTGSNDFALLDCNVYGFISGLNIHGGEKQAWQQNVPSTYTTTSFVLAPADQRPDGYWVGAVGRIMTVSGGGTGNFVVTGYTSSTNTITFATQAAISSTNFYYYLYKGFTKNITVNNLTVDKVDFGIVGAHGEKIVLTELTAYEIEQTQQTNVRPHTIYITNNCKDVYAANMRTYKNLTGDAYKFRGVTNLSIEDGFSTDCRGSFTIENCFNASARNCSNFESGKTGTSAPCIGFITNSKNVFVENCALTVSTNYNGGGNPDLRPFGFLVTASGNTGGYVGFDQVYNEQVTIRNTSITAGNAVDTHYGVLIEGVVAYPSAINKYINIDGVTMFTNGVNAILSLVRTMYSDYVTAQNLQVSGSGTPTVNVQADSTASNTLFLLNKDLANPNVINTGTNTVIHYVAETQSGTWTPVVYGTTNAGTNTYSVQFGTYYKIGNLVTVRCRVTLSGAMASTGQIRISGLPFTASYISGAATSGFMASPSGVSNVTLSSGEIFSVRIDGGADFVSLAKISNTGVANLSDTAFGSGFDLHFAITYMTS